MSEEIEYKGGWHKPILPENMVAIWHSAEPVDIDDTQPFHTFSDEELARLVPEDYDAPDSEEKIKPFIEDNQFSSIEELNSLANWIFRNKVLRVIDKFLVAHMTYQTYDIRDFSLLLLSSPEIITDISISQLGLKLQSIVIHYVTEYLKKKDLTSFQSEDLLGRTFRTVTVELLDHFTTLCDTIDRDKDTR